MPFFSQNSLIPALHILYTTLPSTSWFFSWSSRFPAMSLICLVTVRQERDTVLKYFFFLRAYQWGTVHQTLFDNSPSENDLLVFVILWEIAKLVMTASECVKLSKKSLLLLQLSWKRFRCLHATCISQVLVFLCMFSLTMAFKQTKHTVLPLTYTSK